MLNKDPHHTHTYDAQGNMTCCSLEEKVYAKAGAKDLLKGHHEGDGHDHAEAHGDDDGHDHSGGGESNFKLFLPAIASFVLLMLALAFDNGWLPKPAFFEG